MHEKAPVLALVICRLGPSTVLHSTPPKPLCTSVHHLHSLDPRPGRRRDSEGFSQCLKRAMREDPKPLSPQELHSLTWEAATERFLDVADARPHRKSAALEAALDSLLYAAHNAMTGVEFLRVALGAGSNTRDMPPRITDYHPSAEDVGGFFDNAARVKHSWEGKAPPKKKPEIEVVASAAGAGAQQQQQQDVAQPASISAVQGAASGR